MSPIKSGSARKRGQASLFAPVPARTRSMRNPASEITHEAQILELVRRMSPESRQRLIGNLEVLKDELEQRPSTPKPATAEDSPNAPEAATERSDDSPPSETGETLEAKELVDSVANMLDRRSHQSRLLQDVEGFSRDLEAGRYFSGWGWDPDIDDERAWGDESWVLVMDELFDRVFVVFEQGQRALAGQCFRRLLRLFDLSEEVGVFCGAKAPEAMVKTSLSHAKACYFRSLYDISELEQRAVVLLEDMEELDGIGQGRVGLQAMRDCHSQPMAAFDSFLKRWSQTLDAEVKRQRESPRLFQWDHFTFWLLQEARQLERGLDGLVELARERGHEHPAAYHHWVGRLVQEKRLLEALRAAQEGMERIVKSEPRARMAEIAAELADLVEKPSDALKARRAAFRVQPNARRLLSLCLHGMPNKKTLRNRLKTELRHAEGSDNPPSPRVMALLDLLCGDTQMALSALEDSAILGWSENDHPGQLVFPALLLIGAGQNAPSERSILGKLWQRIDWLLGLQEQSQRERLEILRTCGLDGLADRPMSCKDMLEPTLTNLRIGRERRRGILLKVQEIARERVQQIVSNRYRGAYERACLVAVACAEAFVLAEEREQGLTLLEEIRKAFPNHRAFQRELKSMQNGSVVLPNVA